VIEFKSTFVKTYQKITRLFEINIPAKKIIYQQFVIRHSPISS